MKIIRILMVFAAIMCLTINAGAQDYPTKPVKVIIPFSVGSATDVIARGVSKKLSEIWGVPVKAENLPGKGGTIAASAVAKAPPDGCTLFVHGAFAINPFFHSNLPYDPLKDFTDIAPLVRQPLALVVSPSASIKSVSELIAVAKSKPGQLKFGSPGTGSAGPQSIWGMSHTREDPRRSQPQMPGTSSSASFRWPSRKKQLRRASSLCWE